MFVMCKYLTVSVSLDKFVMQLSMMERYICRWGTNFNHKSDLTQLKLVERVFTVYLFRCLQSADGHCLHYLDVSHPRRPVLRNDYGMDQGDQCTLEASSAALEK